MSNLIPMSEAPLDGTEILAYHKEGKNLHQVKYYESSGTWSTRWNREYTQYTNQYIGWLPMPEVIL